MKFKDFILLKEQYIKSINTMLNECEDLSVIETVKQCVEKLETFKKTDFLKERK